MRKIIKEKLRKYPHLYYVAYVGIRLCRVPVSWMRWLIQRPGILLRQHGYDSQQYAAIREYKEIHEGQRCFVICTGPSLRLEDVDKLKGEICFGMNSICMLYDKTDWRPTYYMIQDVSAFRDIVKNPNFSEVTKIFASNYFYKEITRNIEGVKFPLDYCGELRLSAVLFPGKRQPHYHFSDDPYVVVYNGKTITYSVLQIAVYMGFKEIYLLGADCDYSGAKQHFEAFGEESEIPKGRDPGIVMNAAYRSAREYADTHGIKICNATRGGKLEAFERVNFDELIEKIKAEKKEE